MADKNDKDKGIMATTAATSVGATTDIAATTTTSTTAPSTTGTSDYIATTSHGSTGTSATTTGTSSNNPMNYDTDILVYFIIENHTHKASYVMVKGESIIISTIKEAIRSKISFHIEALGEDVETMKLYGDNNKELEDNTMWSSLVSCGTEGKPLIVKIGESSTNNEDGNDDFEFTDADAAVASLLLYVDKVKMKVYFKGQDGIEQEIKCCDEINWNLSYFKNLKKEARDLLIRGGEADGACVAQTLETTETSTNNEAEHNNTQDIELVVNMETATNNEEDGNLLTIGSDKEESMTTAKTCGIVEEKLLVLVKSTYSRKNPSRPPEYHTTRAANFANEVSPDISRYNRAGEMHLQQVVYNPIAEMFCAFSTNYCANIAVQCAHAIICRSADNPDVSCVASCMHDATLRLTDGFYLIAMMELKVDVQTEPYKKDFFRCVLMTTMSAMAICDFLKNRKGVGIDVAIPFIQGNSRYAELYVTKMNKDDKYPTIHLLVTTYSFVEKNNKEKQEFLAILAVLLSRIVKLTNDNTEMEGHFNKVSGKVDDGTKKRNILSDTFNASSSNQKKQNTNEAKGASENETAAKIVTSQGGLVKGLVHPFPRVSSLNLDLLDDKNAMYKEDLKYFQQESPFFFKGVTEQDGDVFCKVWREGDPHTSRKNIEEEIQLYKRVNAEGIPSPKVVDRLTVLDVECMTSLDTEDFQPSTYHILVTQHHRDDNVAECDIVTFALSLVTAVQKLHSIGILHCDIKPNNVLWDATQKKLLLIDFGHAQETKNARWYTSTRIFEAPEISQEKPHSTKSDVFSVGKTLEYVIANFSNKGHTDIAGVVQSLINESDSKRMSLIDAGAQLKQYNNVSADPTTTATTTTNGSSNCCLATKKRNIGDVNTDTVMDGSPTSVIHI